MYQFPIGVMLDSFRLPVDEALDCARRLGAQGLQVYATKDDLSPENMPPAKRREFLRKVRDRGLTISALCGDLGKGFGDAAQNPALVEASKRILDLAKDLETDVVTTHIGVVPGDPKHPRYAVMQDACGALARYADSVEAFFAVETGPERAVTLKGFLDGLHSRGVGVNLDPANLVMVTADDPAQAVHTLADYIVHTHAKDGRRLLERDPEIIYGLRKDVIMTDEAFVELPLGEGDVDFAAWLAALEAIGYKGFLTIEREVGDDPYGDIGRAVEYLKRLMA